MKPREITPAILPPHLNRCTIEHFVEETPYYVDADVLALRETTSELFVYDNELVSPTDMRPKKLLGRVGLMKAAVIDDETQQLITGYVADMRFIESADDFYDAASEDAPDDQEEFNDWQEEIKHQIPIAAIALEGIDHNETVTAGDNRFAAAALHLASLSDALDQEIQEKEARRKKKLAKKKAQAKAEASAAQKHHKK